MVKHEQEAVGLDGSAWIVLPAEEYAALQRQVATSLGMIRDLERRLAMPQMVPDGVLNAIARGVMPIVAWRKHRRMSQSSLAALVGISPPALHYIEHARHYGRPRTREAIAAALDAPLWALDPPSRADQD